jgi:hypothetical protein
MRDRERGMRWIERCKKIGMRKRRYRGHGMRWTEKWKHRNEKDGGIGNKG